MMKTKAIITFLLIAGISFSATAQNYNTGIGLRAGPSYGLTLKHFVSPNGAIEGIFSPGWGGFTVFGLYEYHATAFEVQKLNWYFGFGGHAGAWWWDHRRQKNGPDRWWWYDDVDRGTVVLGVDMILGLEFTANTLPMNISLDWKPALNLIGHQGFWVRDGAISLRYVFR